MKRYHNIRATKHWTQVNIPREKYWTHAGEFTLLHWCHQYEGKGRFYKSNSIWAEFYFESPEDASMFALVWV